MNHKKAMELFEQLNSGLDLTRGEAGYEDEFTNIAFYGFWLGFNQKPNIYPVFSLAKMTGVSNSRIHKLAESGVIGRKIGGTWIFFDDDIDEVLSRKGKKGRPRNE
jgi:hypothetical protein